MSDTQRTAQQKRSDRSDFAGLDGLKTREIDIFKVRQLSDPLSPFGILPITSASKVKEDPMSYIPYIYIHKYMHYIALHFITFHYIHIIRVRVCAYTYIHIQYIYIYTIIHIHIPMIFPIISHKINMFRCFLEITYK